MKVVYDSTHKVVVDTEAGTAVKHLLPDSPNSEGFYREAVIHEVLGTGRFMDTSRIHMPYYGESGHFRISDVPILQEKLRELQQLPQLGVKLDPLVGPELLDKVAQRCEGTWVCDFFNDKLNSVDISGDTIVVGDLKPANYCTDKEGNIHLIDYETTSFACPEYDWSVLAISLWDEGHPDTRAYFDMKLWSPDALVFKAALLLTYHYWRYGDASARTQRDKYAQLFSELGIAW